MSFPHLLSRAMLDQADVPGAGLSDRLVHVLRGNIRSGVLPPGSRLPSVRAMAALCELSPDTVVRAYRRLVHARDLEALRGSGYYVRGAMPLVPQSPSPAIMAAASKVTDGEALLRFDRPLERMPGTGFLKIPRDASDRARNALRSALRTRSDLDAGYGDPQGFLPLRQQLQRKVASEGVICEPEAIITAVGATGIMNLIVRALVRPGCTAVAEDPGPFLHHSLLLSQGADLLKVPRGDRGPDVDILRRLCEVHRPQIFFCSSLMHNPTGSTISPAVIYRILSLAEEFDMLIVDDASYADLRPADSSIVWTPFAMLGGLSRVIHVGSFSRILNPTLGVGYLVTDESRLPLLRLFRRIHGIGTNLIPERAIYQLLEDGQFWRIQQSVAKSITLQRRKLIADLGAIGYTADSTAAGPFLWLSLGSAENALRRHSRLEEHGFVMARASIFTNMTEYSGYTRLNVTTTGEEVLARLSD